MRFAGLAVPVAIAALCAATAGGQSSPCEGPSCRQSGRAFRARSESKLFFGGYLGLSVGDVTYVEVAPLVGYRITPDLGAGVGLLYRYREDSRYEEDLSSTDYGGNVFARWYVGRYAFLQGEYDYTSYELPAASGAGSARDTYEAFLAGVGVNFNGFYLAALYDFAYDENEPYSLYDSAVQLRFGFTIGF